MSLHDSRGCPVSTRNADSLARFEQALELSVSYRAGAVQKYGEMLIDYPRDLLALQVAHVGDFFNGSSTLLRDRVAQVLPEWDRTMPGYSQSLVHASATDCIFELGAMLSGQIFLGLHLDQPTLRAFEFERELGTPIQFGDRTFGGDDELDRAVVELIDEGDEATCLILGLDAQGGHVADEHGVETAGDLDVIGLATRTVAKFFEREPDDVIALTSRMQATVIQREGRIGGAAGAGDVFEQLL